MSAFNVDLALCAVLNFPFSDLLPIGVDKVLWHVLEQLWRIDTQSVSISSHHIFHLVAVADMYDNMVDGIFLHLTSLSLLLPGWSL